jgi:hypothetical protein
MAEDEPCDGLLPVEEHETAHLTKMDGAVIFMTVPLYIIHWWLSIRNKQEGVKWRYRPWRGCSPATPPAPTSNIWPGQKTVERDY